MRKYTLMIGVLCLLTSMLNLLSAQDLPSATELTKAAQSYLKQTRNERMNYTEENSWRFDQNAALKLRSNNNNIIWIPVQMHIAKGGTNLATSFFNTNLYLRQANEVLIDANIQLYNCGQINIVDDTDAYNLFRRNDTILDAYDNPNAMNIYFVNELKENITGPYYNGPEGGLGLFKQNTQDDNRNWKRKEGATPTSNTGPSAAYEGLKYRYIESSGNNGNPYKSAIITTKKCLNLGGVNNPVFEFRCHMNGVNMGTLQVQLSSDGGTTWSESVWDKTGNQGSSWQFASINLSGYAGPSTRIRVVGITRNGPRSDIAIDDLYIGEAITNLATPILYKNALTTKEAPKQVANSLSVLLYPNPAHDWVNLKFDNPSKAGTLIHLYNQLGQRMLLPFSKIPEGSISIEFPIAELPNGLYFISIQDQDGNRERKSLIINHN